VPKRDPVKRRTLALATAATLVVPCALAQEPRQPRRVGLLAIGTAVGGASNAQRLLDGLRAQGFVPGRDIVIDDRSAGGRTEGLAQLAEQLAFLKPVLIVTYGPQATQAVLSADPNVPVVALLGEVIGLGFAEQLGRPGGRLTGVSFLGTPLNAKRLALLAELLPKGSAILNLGDPSTRSVPLADALDTAARSLGVVAHAAYASTPQEIDKAFATAKQLRVAGVNVLGSPFLDANRAQIIQLAAKSRLPAIYQWPRSAVDGGLLAYGPSQSAINQQLVALVVRILGGAKAGDLPIEQPMLFELIVNLKTAKALGITIPQTVLLQASEVIQ
jgi:putative ABC transport system substrate-binding protein